MASKMLIDASHPEETRVVVMRGNRVEEFDFESANRKQLRGNIYLAKVTRVEPSLQAAFVDYGGNRHGFLAFSEIHPDYYQIPVADRQALIAAQEREQRDAEAEADHRAGRRSGRHRGRSSHHKQEAVRGESREDQSAAPSEEPTRDHTETSTGEHRPADDVPPPPEFMSEAFATPDGPHSAEPESQHQATETDENPANDAGDRRAGEHDAAEPETESAQGESRESAQFESQPEEPSESPSETHAGETSSAESENGQSNGNSAEEEGVESIGGADALEEVQERMPRVRARQYKIQEVIKRRQVMLVQVVKEERGTKGAALTTYLSLAGRYSVLMPNTSRGGGISRKITSAEDRNRLKEIAQELEVPEGMGVILRTAGASRTKTEVKRDFEYLMRIWETVRDLTLKSTAPKLVYEEGSLVKRSIRDLYSKDIDEIIVAGEEGYKDARDFMRMLMPSHAKNVKLYRDTQPVFTRFGIESQLDAMFTPTVQLRSGGYIVINQAEALVAIDVNSGRATREHNIEDTAVKTNSEAAEEIARQLRLRDLAGLIVIDFIDMDESRNNRAVERRMKDALKHDRARIQVGRISHFGLLEMSRQRIRTSVLESSTEKCPICGGSGHVRSVSSVTLALLRSIEETLIKGATHNLIVRTRSEVALYVLNQKRGHLRELEERFQVSITVSADPSVVGAQAFVLDRGEQVHTADQAREIAASQTIPLPLIEGTEEEAIDESYEEPPEADAERPMVESVETEIEDEAEPASGHGERGGRRDDSHRPSSSRRRRGGRGRSGESREQSRPPQVTHDPASQQAASRQDHDATSESSEEDHIEGQPQAAPGSNEGTMMPDGTRRRRRRGRRGGRRHRRTGENGSATQHNEQNGGAQPMAPGGDFGAAVAADDNGVSERRQYEPRQDEPRHYEPSQFEPRDHHQPSSPPAQAASAPPLPPREVTTEAAPASAPDAESPRRGSTVREPVMARSSAPVPVSAPVVSSTTEEPAAPKRGWWGRRILGDKA